MTIGVRIKTFENHRQESEKNVEFKSALAQNDLNIRMVEISELLLVSRQVTVARSVRRPGRWCNETEDRQLDCETVWRNLVMVVK